MLGSTEMGQQKSTDDLYVAVWPPALIQGQSLLEFCESTIIMPLKVYLLVCHLRSCFWLELYGRQLPRWHSGKESTCQCRRHERRQFDPWVGKIRWRRAWQPTPVFLPGNSMDREAWQAPVQEVTKSRTQVSNWAWACAYSRQLKTEVNKHLKC